MFKNIFQMLINKILKIFNVGTLRTCLAICIVLKHAGPLFGFTYFNGILVVDTFFIISGFYMSLILNTKYIGKNSYIIFLKNRFLRIFPLYWSVLIFVIIISVISGLLTNNWLTINHSIQNYAHMNFVSIIFVITSNIIIFGQDLFWFLGLNISNGTIFFIGNLNPTTFHSFSIIGQAWSLGTELIFLLIAPIILRKKIKYILGLIAISLIIRIYMYSGLKLNHDPWNLKFFPIELLPFLLGNISYRIYSFIKDNQTSKKYAQYVGLTFFSLIFLYNYIPLSSNYKMYPYYLFATIAIAYMSLITKKDDIIAEFSFPIYIIHTFVFAFIKAYLTKSEYAHVGSLLTIIISILLSYVLIKLIINPFEKYRHSKFLKLVSKDNYLADGAH